jgi:hypothetical protein
LIRFVEHRIGDPRIVRLIQKWLKAGILENGVVSGSDKGTGQGSVMTPLTQKVTCVAWPLATFGARGRPTQLIQLELESNVG